MSMTDPVADLLTRIRNASKARKPAVDIPASNLKREIVRILRDNKFIRDYLESIHWNKKPPAPTLPPDIVQKTSEKYLNAYKALTGKNLI